MVVLSGIERNVATYGYRLFKFELRDGFGRSPVNLSECAGEHYADIAIHLLQLLKSTQIGRPTLRNSPAPEEENEISGDEVDNVSGQKAFQVISATRVQRAIFGEVFAGLFSEYEVALGVPGRTEDRELGEHAPSKRFRFALVLPEDAVVGVLVVEVIGRVCPVDLLVRWLAYCSQQLALGAESDDEGYDEPSTSRPKAIKWWKPVAQPMMDNDRLQEIIKQGKFGSIELIKHEVQTDRTRRKTKFKLKAPSIDEGVAQEVAAAIKGWFTERLSSENEESRKLSTDKDGAKVLAAIFGESVQNLDFDDGWVQVEDEAGRKTNISPSRMSEIFTYPLSDGKKVDDATFYDQARVTFGCLATAAKIDVDWPTLGKTV
ncbi:hypothetical protein ACIOD2_46480 [Amycolatopsis sp. NPDC088138]|uniref:hypothetical protein n=1 Tax=Amycolatopsis sp. NPDC088138 TaxID=3363938 RepID=UPI0038094027